MVQQILIDGGISSDFPNGNRPARKPLSIFDEAKRNPEAVFNRLTRKAEVAEARNNWDLAETLWSKATEVMDKFIK